MPSRRTFGAVALALLGASACSIATSVPDLTSGTRGVDASAADAADAGDAADAAKAGDAARLCTHSFTYDPKGQALRTVHVAGTFNGWPKTIAGGGWPLAKVGGVWTATRELAPGHYAYKFVLDETDFVPDPGNPKSEPDGFGSTNSLLDVGCGE
jgi:Glycogen recognition site of AMP-activated protein kinase